MPFFLGIDTSNYTTSCAVYDSETHKMISQKKLLPVKSGECGLRQSDAVFHHVQQISGVIKKTLADFDGKIEAIGVSSKPRDIEGSYMPCFTVGVSIGQILSSVLKVPCYEFSHQNNHIAAALYSADQTELLHQEFLAFHVSGGTTEALKVSPAQETIFSVKLAAETLDLNAGQLIDRVGVMLGLDFPCGKELEKLALLNREKLKVKSTLKGTNCCLSGIENTCRRAYQNGMSKETVSAMCLKYIEKTLDDMCFELKKIYGDIPVIFAGGVMSNRIIRDCLSKKYGAFFAEPEFSADNAAGTAFLCSLKHKNN